MDIGAVLKAKQYWEQFQREHPSFPQFLRDVKTTGIPVGSDITISVNYPDGTSKKAGIHVKETDLEILKMFGSLQ